MIKTKTELLKAHRLRKKTEDNERYLRLERERRRRNHLPSEQLTVNVGSKRN